MIQAISQVFYFLKVTICQPIPTIIFEYSVIFYQFTIAG